MNPSLHRRRIARCLIAALLFMVLNPALAGVLAGRGADGEWVLLCTSTGMRWVRMAPHESEVASATPGADIAATRAAEEVGPPADEPVRNSAAACAFCLGAALAAGADPTGPTEFEWPRQAVLTIATPTHGAPSRARVILDAPTRGPPRAQRLA